VSALACSVNASDYRATFLNAFTMLTVVSHVTIETNEM